MSQTPLGVDCPTARQERGLPGALAGRDPETASWFQSQHRPCESALFLDRCKKKNAGVWTQGSSLFRYEHEGRLNASWHTLTGRQQEHFLSYDNALPKTILTGKIPCLPFRRTQELVSAQWKAGQSILVPCRVRCHGKKKGTAVCDLGPSTMSSDRPSPIGCRVTRRNFCMIWRRNSSTAFALPLDHS